jgi:hypothetical protein
LHWRSKGWISRRELHHAAWMDQQALRRAALITLRRAILERFPAGLERTAWLRRAASRAGQEAVLSGWHRAHAAVLPFKRCRRGVALRLSRYFGTTAQLWQNLQTQYDLEIASRKIGKRVESAITPLARPDLPKTNQ